MEYNVINIYEYFNAIYAASVVFILFYVYKVPITYYLIIIFHLFAVFLTNDFLFPISYMPDQPRYFYTAHDIRETLDFLNYYTYEKSGYGNVANAGLFFSLFPIPVINSVFSIAIINFMLYALIFIFLYRKGILSSSQSIWFYLLYPSLGLYAAIGGRDTLILIIMILSIYYLYKGRTIISILISSTLIFIKFQNFFIYVLALLLYKLIDQKKIFTLKNIFKFILVGVGFLLFIQAVSIEEIDRFRYNMYMEDGGDPLQYIPVTGFLDFIITGLTGGIYMLLKPLVWESRNILQLIQSFENLVIFYMIYKIIQSLKQVHNRFKYFLFFYFFIAMGIYGIVVFNFGTAARYKYTFIVIFILFSLKLIHEQRKRKR